MHQVTPLSPLTQFTQRGSNKYVGKVTHIQYSSCSFGLLYLNPKTRSVHHKLWCWVDFRLYQCSARIDAMPFVEAHLTIFNGNCLPACITVIFPLTSHRQYHSRQISARELQHGAQQIVAYCHYANISHQQYSNRCIELVTTLPPSTDLVLVGAVRGPSSLCSLFH